MRLGNGDGTFRDAADIAGISQPEDLVVGDFDADGTEDLAVAGYSAPYTVNVLRGLGDGRCAFHGGFNASNGSRAQSLAVGEDFNGDAVADLASTSTYQRRRPPRGRQRHLRRRRRRRADHVLAGRRVAAGTLRRSGAPASRAPTA